MELEEDKSCNLDLRPIDVWNPENVSKFGRENGLEIPLNPNHGEKGARHLAQELMEQECAFMFREDEKEVVRVVELLTLTVWCSGASPGSGGARSDLERMKAPGNLFLIESAKYANQKKCQWPGHKKYRNESAGEALERLLEELKIPMHALRQTRVEEYSPEVASSSAYPGLSSVYQKTSYWCELVSEDPGIPVLQALLEDEEEDEEEKDTEEEQEEEEEDDDDDDDEEDEVSH